MRRSQRWNSARWEHCSLFVEHYSETGVYFRTKNWNTLLHILQIRLGDNTSAIRRELHPIHDNIYRICCRVVASSQMIEVLALLNQVDICHYDIKDDNWVLAKGGSNAFSPLLTPSQGGYHSSAANIVRICLIDFGIAQDLCSDMELLDNSDAFPSRRQAKEVYSSYTLDELLQINASLVCPD